MEDETYYCEHCTTDGHSRDEVHDNGEFFLCESCYDKEVEQDFRIMDEVRRNAHLIPTAIDRMAKEDPVGFYFACKDDPGRLPY